MQDDEDTLEKKNVWLSSAVSEDATIVSTGCTSQEGSIISVRLFLKGDLI